VLTKYDEVKKAEGEKILAATRLEIAKRPAAYPEIIFTSSRTGNGIPDLRTAIARLLEERGS